MQAPGSGENSVYRFTAANRRILRQVHEDAYCFGQVRQKQSCAGREPLVLHRPRHSIPEPVHLLRYPTNLHRRFRTLCHALIQATAPMVRGERSLNSRKTHQPAEENQTATKASRQTKAPAGSENHETSTRKTH